MGELQRILPPDALPDAPSADVLRTAAVQDGQVFLQNRAEEDCPADTHIVAQEGQNIALRPCFLFALDELHPMNVQKVVM